MPSAAQGPSLNDHTPDAHPYLRAATVGLRHHTRAHSTSTPAADRPHLDTLHAHLTAATRLVDQLADAPRPTSPAAGRHLADARLRLWQASAAVHDAFHTTPADTSSAASQECRPEQLPDGPLVLTICQRHLAVSHTIRRTTTPARLAAPPPAHSTSCTV
ncbi:DUF6238 family protein [Streptomyces acidiscabies]|uniref:DUF6238 family protein n=1 Tax=Streptomyces acidiscabies TaxID=42234 RepID=UPI00273DFAE1|nr:DUF6238 family protein [Streptomyces acidiscabies]